MTVLFRGAITVGYDYPLHGRYETFNIGCYDRLLISLVFVCEKLIYAKKGW